MFADLRSRNTAAAVSSPIAIVSSVRRVPRSHSTANSAAITPLRMPVSAMWPVLKTELLATTSIGITGCSSQGDDPYTGGHGDQRGLGDLDASLQQERERDGGDRDRCARGDDLLADDDRRAGDRTRGGCRRALDESQQPRVLAVTAQIPAWNDHEQIHRKKHRGGCDQRTANA